MRKRFNRNAVCSSENYSASKKAHLELLKEQHEHFSFLSVSREVVHDVPTEKKEEFQPKFKTVKILNREMRLTIEEYNTIYAKCNF
jgi:hypothetical protein